MTIDSRAALLIFLAGSLTVLTLSLIFRGQLSPDPPNEPVPLNTNTATGSFAERTNIVEKDSNGSILSRYDLRASAATTCELPESLREISGLAMTDDGRLLAHNDEVGVIFEVDYRNGEIIKSFGIADGLILARGDFEGIAVADDNIYMVTSMGTIYEFSKGENQESVSYEAYPTRAGRGCEIEGLAFQPSDRSLLLIGKNPRNKRMLNHVAIFHWSIDHRTMVGNATIMIPVREFTYHIKSKRFQPSGIEWHPESGHYFIVAAQQKAVAEISPSGQVLDVRILPGKWHRQAEGITFTPDHSLLISDEGKGKHARITLYPLTYPLTPTN